MPTPPAWSGARAMTACMVAALLHTTGCDSVLGLDDLEVEPSAGGAGAGGSHAGSGGAGGASVDACGATPGESTKMAEKAIAPAAVALGSERVFWTEAPASLVLLQSATPCGENNFKESSTTRSLLPYLAALGDNACWVTAFGDESTLQCGNKSAGGEFAGRTARSIGDVVLTVAGVFWAESPAGGPWRIMHASSPSLTGVASLYEADPGVDILALAASAEILVWTEHHGLDGAIVTSELSATQLTPSRWLDAATQYDDVAATGQKILASNGKSAYALDLEDPDLQGKVFTAPGDLRQVAFSPTGEPFVLASDADGKWSVTYLSGAGNTAIVSGIDDARGFAVGSDAIYYSSAMPSMVFRHAR